jgi:hypothetical protein
MLGVGCLLLVVACLLFIPAGKGAASLRYHLGNASETRENSGS